MVETMAEHGANVPLSIGLGLLGLGAALMFVRVRCPACRTKVENGAPYCHGCRSMLTWPSH